MNLFLNKSPYQIINCLLILTVITQVILAQTTFHGNMARTGVYQSSGPKQFNGVKWKFKTKGAIVASPAIAGGVVFIGSADGFLYAIDQKTGQQKWKFESKGPINSSPTVGNGIVYFGSDDGGFYALNAQDGTLKWRFAMQYERRFQAKHLHGSEPSEQTMPDAWDFFTSSPAVFNGQVFFGSGDKNVYALDAQSGVLKWKFATGDVVHASPTIANNTVFIGSWDSYFYALDADTGKEKWRFKTGEDFEIYNQVGFQSSSTIADGTIYVGCRDAHIYAIDAKTGVKKWDIDTKGAWVSATPAVRQDHLFIGTGDSKLFHIIDAKSGKVQSTFNAKSMIFSSPAIAGNLAYFGDLTGRFYALDITNGKLAWDFQTEGSQKDPLKMLNADGTWNQAAFTSVFFNYQDSYLNMYRRFSVGSILSSPVIDSGEIYFGSTDGFLYALQ